MDARCINDLGFESGSPTPKMNGKERMAFIEARKTWKECEEVFQGRRNERERADGVHRGPEDLEGM
jgi:hypothetical protein